MTKLLYSIRWAGEPPTLEQVQDRFGLGRDEVDQDFGVVATAPDENLYAILVEDSAIDRLRGTSTETETETVEGPFSDPRIEPFDLQGPAHP